MLLSIVHEHGPRRFERYDEQKELYGLLTVLVIADVSLYNSPLPSTLKTPNVRKSVPESPNGFTDDRKSVCLAQLLTL
eukprot:1088918-Amphidinium_carterae.1